MTPLNKKYPFADTDVPRSASQVEQMILAECFVKRDISRDEVLDLITDSQANEFPVWELYASKPDLHSMRSENPQETIVLGVRKEKYSSLFIVAVRGSQYVGALADPRLVEAVYAKRRGQRKAALEAGMQKLQRALNSLDDWDAVWYSDSGVTVNV